jgi:hypothetical protein
MSVPTDDAKLYRHAAFAIPSEHAAKLVTNE